MSPESLFTRKGYKQQYRKLAAEHHPDKGGDPAVFAEITAAYNTVKNYRDDEWKYGGVVSINNIPYPYLMKDSYELGEVFIMGDRVVYSVKAGNTDLMNRFDLGTKKAREFKGDKTRAEFVLSVPRITIFNESPTPTGMSAISTIVPQGYMRLKDVHEAEPLSDRHVAWIVSRLLNLCCWLSVAGVVHNAISTENVFIDPVNHRVALLGGWFYSVNEGQKLLALPKKTVEFGPSNLLRDKVGSHKTDLELVKVLARELVGSNAPKAMLSYLDLPAGDVALKEFKYWYDVVLTEAFGPKKFVELKVGNIYKIGE
jgi:hypothetical protein